MVRVLICPNLYIQNILKLLNLQPSTLAVKNNLSPQKWVRETNVIGITYKSWNNGGLMLVVI